MLWMETREETMRLGSKILAQYMAEIVEMEGLFEMKRAFGLMYRVVL